MSLSGHFKLYFFGTSQIQDISLQNSHPTMTLNFKLMHTHWQGPNDTEWNSSILGQLRLQFWCSLTTSQSHCGGHLGCLPFRKITKMVKDFVGVSPRNSRNQPSVLPYYRNQLHLCVNRTENFFLSHYENHKNDQNKIVKKKRL